MGLTAIARLKAAFFSLLQSNSIPLSEGDRENGLYQTNEVRKRQGRGFGGEDGEDGSHGQLQGLSSEDDNFETRGTLRGPTGSRKANYGF
jgi:hypothetical protein